jgi:hypothetical protein
MRAQKNVPYFVIRYRNAKSIHLMLHEDLLDERVPNLISELPIGFLIGLAPRPLPDRVELLSEQFSEITVGDLRPVDYPDVVGRASLVFAIGYIHPPVEHDIGNKERSEDRERFREIVPDLCHQRHNNKISFEMSPNGKPVDFKYTRVSPEMQRFFY